MTLQEFYNKYNGQANVGNTAVNKGECVGLSSLWMDNFGVPHVYGHAKDLYANAPDEYFAKIPNTPDAIVQEGDIVVWSAGYNGTYGHTGVAKGKSDVSKFECFQQNDPLGSKPHMKTYNYAYVIGWLRPRKMSTNPPVSGHSEKDVHKPDDSIKRAYKALCGVWVNQNEIDPWIKKGISLDDTMIEIMKGDDRFYTLWIEPELEEQEEAHEKKIVELMLDVEKAKKDLANYVAQQELQHKEEENVEVTTITYPRPESPKTPSNSMDKPKPVSIDPAFSGPFVNLLRFLKKKLGF